jgi:hypothetical protein
MLQVYRAERDNKLNINGAQEMVAFLHFFRLYVSCKIRLGSPNIPGFSKSSKVTFLITRTNILTFTPRGKMSMGVGHPSTCHQQQEMGAEKNCVQISDYRAWTKTAKNEKRI